MADVWRECSGKAIGEQRLARHLKEICDRDAILCFNVDFIPGGREIDLLLVHRGLGAYIIEIKAVPLHAIKSISPNKWQISGRSSDESPLVQAYNQYEGLRSYWDARMKSRLPHIAITACLPEISRVEWTQAFHGAPYPLSLADRMIFREDTIDSNRLTVRLHEIMRNPPIRSGREPREPAGAFLGDLHRLMQPSAPQSATKSDRSRLQVIEKAITNQLRGEFPAGGEKFVTFSGQPGTGKTFRLLSIGLLHAYSNKRVLFVCFNKTLASDVRRLLSFEEKLKHATYGLEALDVNQIALRCFERNGLSYLPSNDADDWGRMVVAHLQELGDSAIHEEYDTVLIDEAHDMQDWQLDLVKMHAAKTATVCLALGKGQELYREETAAVNWLKNMAKLPSVENKELRKNFRNPTEQFFAAMAFHKAWPDKLALVSATYRKLMNNKRQSELEFERRGEPLQYIAIPEIPGEFDDLGNAQLELVSDEYAEIIGNEIDSLREDINAHPVGMLVLVPDGSSAAYAWVLEALKKATSKRHGVSFIDYTVDKAKRGSARSEEIRLCTFHSARGLEGERVLIFGLEQIDALARSTNVKPENLGFIALSRGVFRTAAVVRTYYSNTTHVLLREILHVQGL